MREGEGIDYSILHCTSIPEKKKKKKKKVYRCWLSWERSPRLSLATFLIVLAGNSFLIFNANLLEVNTRGSIHYPPSTYADFHVQNSPGLGNTLFVLRKATCVIFKCFFRNELPELLVYFRWWWTRFNDFSFFFFFFFLFIIS